jgi:hypothetical protein
VRNPFITSLTTLLLLTAPGGAVAQPDQDPDSDSRSSRFPQRGEEDKDEVGDDAPPPLDPNCVAKGVCMDTVAVVAAKLQADGPQAPAGTGTADLRQVQGFVRDGWPVVVDFEPVEGTRTDLLVVLYEAIPARIFFPRKVRIVMDDGGLGGRQLFTGRIEFPAEPAAPGGRPVGVASYQVVSRRLKPDGRVSKKRAPVTVYGVGAGPRAVGSITLTDVTLGNGTPVQKLPASGGLSLNYGYRLKAAFDLVAQDFARNNKVETARFQRVSGNRTGRLDVRKPGIYRLNVRAWLSCPTPDFSKCGDAGAWATGQSARIRVEK